MWFTSTESYGSTYLHSPLTRRMTTGNFADFSIHESMIYSLYLETRSHSTTFDLPLLSRSLDSTPSRFADYSLDSDSLPSGSKGPSSDLTTTNDADAVDNDNVEVDADAEITLHDDDEMALQPPIGQEIRSSSENSNPNSQQTAQSIENARTSAGTINTEGPRVSHSGRSEHSDRKRRSRSP